MSENVELLHRLFGNSRRRLPSLEWGLTKFPEEVAKLSLEEFNEEKTELNVEEIRLWIRIQSMLETELEQRIQTELNSQDCLGASDKLCGWDFKKPPVVSLKDGFMKFFGEDLESRFANIGQMCVYVNMLSASLQLHVHIRSIEKELPGNE